MTNFLQGPALLSVHGVRVLGFSTAGGVAELYGLDEPVVSEHLLDAEAYGWVHHSSFADQSGWAITERGRETNEQSLAAELDERGGRGAVMDAHRDFLPLNRRLGELMTRWQLRPVPGDPMAPNDHRDPSYDGRIVRGLTRLIDQMRPVTDALTSALPRFGVHQPRLDHALRQVQGLRNEWVDASHLPSLNLTWIHFHEDLLATLGIDRGEELSAPNR